MENKNKKPKVLLTYIESGMGHITSMEAVQEALENKYSDVFNIEAVYPSEDDGPAKAYEIFQIKGLKKTNEIPGFGSFIFGLFEIIGKEKFLRFFHRTCAKKSTDSIVAFFEKENPDIIVSTNHYMTFCAYEYKDRHNPDVMVITYNPDNNTHVWWDNRPSPFIVNNEMAYDEALWRKFDESCLRRVNFTVRQHLVDATLTKEQYREKYNLPQDKFTVIIADGVYALAQSKKFTKHLVKTNKPITIIFIAGKNKKMFDYMNNLKDKLEKQGKTNITMRVFPFVKDIHELYAAADVFITKSGPNSIFDSVYMGTPIVVNYYSQPMEKASYKLWVKKLKCGVSCFRARKIKPLIESFIDDPSLLDVYRKNIEQFKNQPSGSIKAADIIYEEYMKMKENKSNG